LRHIETKDIRVPTKCKNLRALKILRPVLFSARLKISQRAPQKFSTLQTISGRALNYLVRTRAVPAFENVEAWRVNFDNARGTLSSEETPDLLVESGDEAGRND